MYTLLLLTLLSAVPFFVFHFMPGFYFRWCRREAVFFICLCRPCLAQFWGGMNNKPSISRNWFARIENQVQISSSYVRVLELILFCTQRDFHAINKKTDYGNRRGKKRKIKLRCESTYLPNFLIIKAAKRCISLFQEHYFVLAKISPVATEDNLSCIYAKKTNIDYTSYSQY